VTLRRRRVAGLAATGATGVLVGRGEPRGDAVDAATAANDATVSGGDVESARVGSCGASPVDDTIIARALAPKALPRHRCNGYRCRQLAPVAACYRWTPDRRGRPTSLRCCCRCWRALASADRTTPTTQQSCLSITSQNGCVKTGALLQQQTSAGIPAGSTSSGGVPVRSRLFLRRDAVPRSRFGDTLRV
jgi:hypothetical protein